MSHSAAQSAANKPPAGSAPPSLALCLHCQLPVDEGGLQQFCCGGCEAVYTLLHENDLQRYYTLRRGAGSAITDRPAPARDLSWLDEAYQADSRGDQKHLCLDIQGIHCSGCVWVLEKTFHRHDGALKIITNPALGQVDLWFSSEFSPEQWLRSVERFGYRFGPSLKSSDRESDSILVRVGICIALAVNVMVLSAALYLGLDQGPLYRIFRVLSYGLATLSVVIGGPVFFRSALAGLRHRVLHLDVPISAGIILAFAGSSWSFWSGRDRALYLDSVSVFIALMLLGRYLQERVLNANRNRLLASRGCEGLRSKRLRSSEVHTIKSTEILLGDRLIIAPGDLVPVSATLLSSQARVSTDWINGESLPTRLGQGSELLAGSFNAGNQSFQVRATANFASSPLQALLSPDLQGRSAAHETSLMRAVSRYYVLGVLLSALGGFAVWLALGSGLAYAFEIATAVLVVSCPCAFGIATPLAHELVLSHLRKSGLFVRSGDFLHRLGNVRKIVFDKTGTLTTGHLKLLNSEVLQTLSSNESLVLLTLVNQSNHPVSEAVANAIKTKPCAEMSTLCVTEITGKGLECRSQGHRYRLGSASWAGNRSAAGTLFSRDDEVLLDLQLGEQPRSDAQREMLSLSNEGFELFLLSGDSAARVHSFATQLGLSEEHVFAEQSPEDKEQWLVAHDKGDILFIGDGINDTLAAQAASCSGTPALDRPYMASHCDFYLGTNRIAPIREALHASRALLGVVRRNIAFALVYNVGAISLAWAGLMRPWLAAILMPTSSVLVVLATTITLAPRKRPWTS